MAPGGGLSLVEVRRLWPDIVDATATRVDLTTGDLAQLAHGPGPGWVTLAPDGALYIETNGTTQRWPTLDAPTAEPTIPDLHLTMPMDRPFCEGCG